MFKIKVHMLSYQKKNICTSKLIRKIKLEVNEGLKSRALGYKL
jgi:hypothetical protein